MTLELSVAVVTYQCREFVLDCLADLDVARGDIALEVIVVDNASTDGTVEEVCRRFPWVRVDALGENIGFGRANNRAINAATAPAVLILNPDTRIHARDLLSMLEELSTTSSVGLVGPRVVDSEGQVDPNCRRGFPTVLGILGAVTGTERVVRWRPVRQYHLAWLRFDEAADVVSLSGAAMLARRSVLEEVGGFDNRFFMYGEDIDLCLRVARTGWRVRYHPAATVVHIGGGSPGSARTRRAWSRAIGDIHRIHRPGIRGRISALVCDAAGAVLAPVTGPRRAGGRQRKGAAHGDANSPATLDRL